MLAERRHQPRTPPRSRRENQSLIDLQKNKSEKRKSVDNLNWYFKNKKYYSREYVLEHKTLDTSNLFLFVTILYDFSDELRVIWQISFENQRFLNVPFCRRGCHGSWIRCPVHLRERVPFSESDPRISSSLSKQLSPGKYNMNWYENLLVNLTKLMRLLEGIWLLRGDLRPI